MKPTTTKVWFVAVSVCLFCFAGASMAFGQWLPHGPGGGDVEAVAIDPTTPTTIYAATSGGVLKSINGGARWTSSLAGPWITKIAIDPQNPSTIYAGATSVTLTDTNENPNQHPDAYGGLFKSSDAGKTWTQLSGRAVLALVVAPTTPSTVYVAGSSQDDRVVKSTDGGNTWTSASTGMVGDGSIGALAVDPANPSTLYASGCCLLVNNTQAPGVFKTTDGGGSWTPFNTNLFVDDIVIDPTTPSTLYAIGPGNAVLKSVDGGANWNSASSGLPPSAHSLAINPSISSVVYAGTLLGLYASIDGGGNWFPIGNGITGFFIFDVKVDRSAPTTLYAATSDRGLFKTTNGGSSWLPINTGMTNSSITGLVAGLFSSTTALYAARDSGMSISTNRGLHWIDISVGLPQAGVHAVALDERTPSILYAGTDSGVFKTTNGGVSWFPVNNGILPYPYTAVHAIAVDPATGNVFAGTDGGLCISLDGGGSWGCPSGVSLLSRSVFSIVEDSKSRILYISTREFGAPPADLLPPLKFDMATFQILPLNPATAGSYYSSVAVDPSAPNTLYVRASQTFVPPFALGGIFKSTDGGLSWTQIAGDFIDNLRQIVVDPRSPKTLYAAGRGVWISRDGGFNWSLFSDGLGSSVEPGFLPTGNVITFDPVMHEIYVGTDGTGMFSR
jgi:photosystem II stability/assembly factor-like uncharacterized protein